MTYPGGKGRSYQRLINLMPHHRVYIESHLGSGAVLRNKRAAERSIGVEIDPVVIGQWRSDPLCGFNIVQADAVDYLSEFNYLGDELIYSDPPYVPTTRFQSRVYRHDYTIDDHVRLLEGLKSAQCMVMLSGYDNELYNDELSSWRKVSFSAQSQSGLRTEQVWMNFDAPSQLHDSSFIGNTFRERQSIKRRKERWIKKFGEMGLLERNDVLNTILSQYGEPERIALCKAQQ